MNILGFINPYGHFPAFGVPVFEKGGIKYFQDVNEGSVDKTILNFDPIIQMIPEIIYINEGKSCTLGDEMIFGVLTLSTDPIYGHFSEISDELAKVFEEDHYSVFMCLEFANILDGPLRSKMIELASYKVEAVLPESLREHALLLIETMQPG